MKSKLQIDDEVVVLAGRDKGRTGFIVEFKGNDRVVVGNVNVVQRHQKAQREGEQSGIISKDAAIHISNVAIVNAETGKRDKVRVEEREGERVRVFKSNGKEID